MHIDSSPLSIIFKYVLFTLLIYKIYELIKTYAIPYLKQQRTLLQKKQVELVEKETLLTSTIKRVENQIAQQKKMTILLEKKMQIWHHFTVEKHLEEERKCRNFAIKLQAKRKIQQKQLNEIKMLGEVIPIAVEKASQELSALYEGPKGAELLKKFIDQFSIKY